VAAGMNTTHLVATYFIIINIHVVIKGKALIKYTCVERLCLPLILKVLHVSHLEFSEAKGQAKWPPEDIFDDLMWLEPSGIFI
jgi:hypothetical protein